jgi:signal transduction histidine kinase
MLVAMSSANAIRQPWLKWGLIFGLWTFIGLAFSSQFYLSRANSGMPVSWRFALEHSLVAEWYLFALLSIPALWLARRFRFERAGWPGRLALHLLASAGFSILWMIGRALVEEWLSAGGERQVTFKMAFTYALATFFFNGLVYWAIITVSHSVEYYRKYQERELRTAELEVGLAQARLQALQMQLNPHFLFNTLHSISSLMHKDIEAADRMISRFSDLLRLALENTDAHEVSLRQELEFLKSYLDIEQTRFGERLSVRLEIAPEALDARVPNLVLQPLVENAIQHGIEPHARPGLIELCARRENGNLLLEVRDNGNGLSQHSRPTEGVGVSNTRARLQHLYGDAQSFEFRNGETGGLLVSVSIPFRTISAGLNETGENSGRDLENTGGEVMGVVTPHSGPRPGEGRGERQGRSS